MVYCMNKFLNWDLKKKVEAMAKKQEEHDRDIWEVKTNQERLMKTLMNSLAHFIAYDSGINKKEGQPEEKVDKRSKAYRDAKKEQANVNSNKK